MLYKSVANMMAFIEFLLDTITAAGRIQSLVDKEFELEQLKGNLDDGSYELCEGDLKLLEEFWRRFQKLRSTSKKYNQCNDASESNASNAFANVSMIR
ncbi:hypothetical protein ACOME3_007665 [Neoechinorhynchus agilis]